MDGLLTTLVLKQFPDGFIVHLWHKDIGSVGAGINDTRRTALLSVQGLLLLRG
jgi:hypothetical protein